MDSEFSTAARAARALIPVPAAPIGSIRNRARSDRARSRMRVLVASSALALGGVGLATGAGARIVNDVRVWLNGDQVATVVHSGVLLRNPKAGELRAAIAKATFPVIFPVGVPAGTRITMVTLAPADRPSAITVSYHNDAAGFKASFALIDPAVVAPDGAAVPAASSSRTAYHWNVAGEIVGTVAPPSAEIERIKAAMLASTPAESLAANEAMLTKLTVLGATVRLAIAERYAPPNGPSVLLDETQVASIPRLVQSRDAILDRRIDTITNISYKHGDLANGTAHASKVIAVSAGGVRAIDAALHAGGTRLHAPCGCEVLFTRPEGSTYWVWIIPLSGTDTVKKFAVDARTLAVTPVPVRPAK